MILSRFFSTSRGYACPMSHEKYSSVLWCDNLLSVQSKSNVICYLEQKALCWSLANDTRDGAACWTPRSAGLGVFVARNRGREGFCLPRRLLRTVVAILALNPDVISQSNFENYLRPPMASENKVCRPLRPSMKASTWFCANFKEDSGFLTTLTRRRWLAMYWP